MVAFLSNSQNQTLVWIFLFERKEARVDVKTSGLTMSDAFGTTLSPGIIVCVL